MTEPWGIAASREHEEKQERGCGKLGEGSSQERPTKRDKAGGGD